MHRALPFSDFELTNIPAIAKIKHPKIEYAKNTCVEKFGCGSQLFPNGLNPLPEHRMLTQDLRGMKIEPALSVN
jgi:hypothetical protein